MKGGGASVLATIKKLLKWTSLPAIVLFVLLLVYNAVINPGFMKQSTFYTFLLTSTPTLCVVMGVFASKIVGGIDISLGSLLSLINVTLAWMFTNTDLPTALVLAIGVLMGMTGGLINGISIGVLRVNPLLATFASSSVYGGLALWIMPNPGGFGVPQSLIRFTNRIHFGFIPSALIYLMIPLALWLIYALSVRVVAVYGIGGNEQCAYISGMPVMRIKMLAHIFGGLCAAVGAIAVTGLIASGDPTIGNEFSLKAVTAVVIGGVALSGGEGDIWGALFGGLFLTMILITIVSSKVPTFAQNFANAAILFVGLLLAVLIKLVSEYKRTHPRKEVKNYD